MAHTSLPPATLEWQIADGLVDYDHAVATMEARAEAIRAGTASELVWLVEHPPLYTAGTSAKPEDLLDAQFPVHRSGRGGQFTYHGPGQRIAYVMLDLARRGPDVRGHVQRLEAWMIATLAQFGVTAVTRADRIGVWVVHPTGREDKIGAIGVRVRRWVTLHGMALNVAPDLSHFGGIVPCGIREHGVTSLRALGVGADMAAVDKALAATFPTVFGRET
ncbi:MAG: lipoyl(octanoyl) transferase LipB [Alphaproteobacteria bacterium]|nr:MAG: lipoyl(octanoyl) transferase LipB [Alphaproteobacteria bacterium]